MKDKMWWYDHGADWSSRAGDVVSKPFYKLSQWFYWKWRKARDERKAP